MTHARQMLDDLICLNLSNKFKIPIVTNDTNMLTDIKHLNKIPLSLIELYSENKQQINQYIVYTERSLESELKHANIKFINTHEECKNAVDKKKE